MLYVRIRFTLRRARLYNQKGNRNASRSVVFLFRTFRALSHALARGIFIKIFIQSFNLPPKKNILRKTISFFGSVVFIFGGKNLKNIAIIENFPQFKKTVKKTAYFFIKFFKI